MAMPWRLLRVGLYNPMTVSYMDRFEDVSATLSGADIVLLLGTQRRAPPGLDIDQFTAPAHRGLSWGHGRWKYSNKPAGVAILTNQKRLPAENVVKYWTPGASIRGRAGAARWKTRQLDVTCIVAYYPPRGSLSAEDMQGAVVGITRFIDDVLREAPRRSAVVLGMDLNDQIGLEDNGERLVDYEGIGPHGRGAQHAAGDAVVQLARRRSLAFVTTYYRLGPTYFGNNGARTRIDHILLPGEFMQGVRSAAHSRKAMAQLQHVKSLAPRDHCPAFVEVALFFSGGGCRSTEGERVRLDRPALLRAITTGEGRAEYYEALQRSLVEQASDEEWKEAQQEPTPDTMWAKFCAAVCAAAAQTFPKQPEADKQYSDDRAERLRLLAERRQLRIEKANIFEQGDGASGKEESLEQLDFLLSIAIIRCRRVRRQQYHRRVKVLCDKIGEAWRRRRFAELYQLKTKLAGNGYGVKMRRYKAPRAAQPELQEWVDLLGSRGHQGGLQAQVFDYANYEQEVMAAGWDEIGDFVPDDPEMTRQVVDDRRGTT